MPSNSIQVQKYKNRNITKWLIIFGLLLLLFLSLILSMSLGAADMTFVEVMKAFFHRDNSINSLILYQLRLPRIVVAVVVGASLSVAGCVLQSVLRNPLASASTLGISQGASFGAALGIILTEISLGNAVKSASNGVNPYLITFYSFLGSIASSVIILLLSRFKKLKPSSMILVGVALSSLFSGGLSLAQYFASETAMASIVFWTLGDLGSVGWSEIAIISIVFLLIFVFFMLHSWKYNAMESGLETAKSLGVKVEALTIVSMVLASLLAGASVAFVGIINFIGLVAPHIARKIIGNNHVFLLPASAIIGGIILVLADLVGRMVISPVILPIGAITSFLGAPLFLYFIFREKVQ